MDNIGPWRGAHVGIKEPGRSASSPASRLKTHGKGGDGKEGTGHPSEPAPRIDDLGALGFSA